MISRSQIADQIVKKIQNEKARSSAEYKIPGRIPSFWVDNLLEEDLALEIYRQFPPPEKMRLRDTMREQKYVAAQMNLYPSLLEEAIYAFQDPRIVNLVSEITGMKGLLPDEKLYAGGISVMTQGNFLNPHLDNSHDLDRKNYRVLNLLYYVTPDWREEYGGNLELWDQSPRKPGRTIVSKFNRLVVMATGKDSWHSVSRVQHAGSRCCISNYYFSPYSPEKEDYFHVTSFRGRPEEKLKDILLSGDNLIRNGIRFFFKRGIVKTHHLYQKP